MSESSRVLTAVPSLGATLGAIYTGAMLAAILFGITNLQVGIYYRRYPNDWWVYRYSVGILWVLDALHLGMSTHAVYHYVVDTFGNYEEIYNIIWSFKLQILLSMVIIVGVQAIYAIRIWKLGRHFNKIIPWFVVLTVAAAFGAGIFSVYAEYTISSFLSISRIKASTCVVFSVPAISDFIIAFAMCYYLHKCREASEFASTSAMVLRLMRLVVVSGLATSACSLLTLITYLVWPNTLIFLGVDLVLPKFYINSLLVMLNFRPDHRTAARSHSSELRVLRFAPRDSRSDVDEVVGVHRNSTSELLLMSVLQSISIPMENIQSLEHTK